MNDHSCSYHCRRFECIEAQRNELRDKMEQKIVEAVAMEREECAVIMLLTYGGQAADIIRARGEQK